MLVNPTAGKGRGARVGLRAIARLRERGAAVRVLAGRSGADVADLAAAAVRAEPDALVVVGGDGMVHLTVQALAGSSVPLGLVPAGGGNDPGCSLRRRAAHVRVESPGIVAYGDGERLGPLPIDVTVEPGALRTLAP